MDGNEWEKETKQGEDPLHVCCRLSAIGLGEEGVASFLCRWYEKTIFRPVTGVMELRAEKRGKSGVRIQ